MRAQSTELKVDARFLGFVPPGELRAAYNAATMLVHTCAVETFGLSVSEAMACGTPVVAARGGALPEVMGEAGILVPPENLDEFAHQIGKLFADPLAARRLGELGRRRSVTEFSVERMVERYEQVLLDLEDAR